MAEPRRPARQPGWREVVLLAVAAVAVVLGAAIATSFMPDGVQQLVFHTPLAIAVLVIGTGWLLWRIARHSADTPDR